MAFERKWREILPVNLVQDGGTDGRVVLNDTIYFKVKQLIKLSATGQPDEVLEVKQVSSRTTLFVGPKNKNINSRQDISAYTIANGAKISAAIQDKSVPGWEDQYKHNYEQEPVLARRVIEVDPYGDFYKSSNPFPTTISDGENTLKIEPDGSIDANVTLGGISTPTIENFSATVANNEYKITIPANTKQYSIRCRGQSKIQYSFILGESDTNYITIKPGSIHKEQNLKLVSDLYIYIRTSISDQTIEILKWS